MVGNRAGLRAEGVIKRKDFGMAWNKTLDFGGIAVGEEVTIVLDIEAMEKVEKK